MYKDCVYKVLNVKADVLIQDPLGSWVPTVFYESEPDIGKTFVRAITDFNHKFRRVSR